MSKRISKSITILLILAIATTGLSGCYWNAQVEASEVGLILKDGVSITEVVGAGRYSDALTWFAELKILDMSAKTVTWFDPDLVTYDKQPIGLTLSITYSRDRSTEQVELIWRDYRQEALDDAALENQVLTRIPAVAKEVTVKYTLDELLGTVEGEDGQREVNQMTGRGPVTNDLISLLQPQLSEFGVRLLDVRIGNIDPGTRYLELLKDKANAAIGVEVAKAETLRLKEQFLQEQETTNIEVERARRQNLVNEELAQVYALNPQYFELERLKLLANVVGDTDKVYFVPEGSDLTLLLSGLQPDRGVIPIEP